MTDKPSERELAESVLAFLMDNTNNDVNACVRVLVTMCKVFQLGSDMHDSGGSFEDYCRKMQIIMNSLDDGPQHQVQ